jgi:hypothetical protein
MEPVRISIRSSRPSTPILLLKIAVWTLEANTPSLAIFASWAGQLVKLINSKISGFCANPLCQTEKRF